MLHPSGVLDLQPPSGFDLGTTSPSGVSYSLAVDRFRTNLFFNEVCNSIGTYTWHLTPEASSLWSSTTPVQSAGRCSAPGHGYGRRNVWPPLTLSLVSRAPTDPAGRRNVMAGRPLSILVVGAMLLVGCSARTSPAASPTTVPSGSVSDAAPRRRPRPGCPRHHS